MSILAVDLGGTNIKVGLIKAGRIVRRESLEARSAHGAEQAMTRLTALLLSMRDADCTGVGIAVPTLVDVRTHHVTGEMIGKYEGLSRFDFAAWSLEELQLPVRIENDAHAALLGEWRFGAGRNCDDQVMMTMGTGIGTSVLMNGRPLRGKHAQAGNLGAHMIIDPNGFPCVCGSRGCGEAQQHRDAVARIAREDPVFSRSALADVEKIDYEALFRLAGTDELASRLLRRSLDIWATMAVSLVHQFDCERLIMGGGIMKSAHTILPHVNQWLATACTPWGEVQAVASELGDDAALHGMAVSVSEDLQYI